MLATIAVGPLSASAAGTPTAPTTAASHRHAPPGQIAPTPHKPPARQSGAKVSSAPPPTFPTGRPSSEPQGVAVATDGSIWLADLLANEIGHFNPTTQTFAWYIIPTANSGATGIVFDAGTSNVWFTESNSGQIGEIPAGAPPGSNAREFAVPSGTLSVPTGLSVDPNGTVWFAENGTNMLGELVPQRSGPPTVQELALPAGCSGPEGATADATGNVWTACEDSSSIAVHTPSGVTHNYPSTTAPEQLSIDPSGNVWFTEWGPSFLGKINPSTAVDSALPGSDPGLTEVSLASVPCGQTPSAIRVDTAGTVWFTGAGGQCIGSYQPATASFATYPTPEQISTSPEGNEGNGMAIDGPGNVWYAGYVSTSGYLGELPGVASGLVASGGGTVTGGFVGAPLIVSGTNTSLHIPGNTSVFLPDETPFTGTIHPLTPATAALPAVQDGSIVANSAFNATATTITDQHEPVLFSQPITLSFPVTVPAGSTALISSFDAVSQLWKEAGVTAGDPGGSVSGGIATLQTSHLGLFALITPTARVATTQTFTLTAGWNMFGFSVSPPSTKLTDVLASLGTTDDVLFGFDRSNGGVTTYFADPAKAILNNLTDLEPLHGYWIHMKTGATLSVTGTPVPSVADVALFPGWNLVTFRGTSSESIAQALEELSGQADAVFGFNSSQGGTTSYFSDPAKAVLDNLPALQPGSGYWVHLAGTVPLAWSAQTTHGIGVGRVSRRR